MKMGPGCRYYLGDWKDEKFIPGFHGWMNWHKGEIDSRYGHGGDVFAPESLLAPDGRRVMWAWLFAQSKLRVSPNWQEVMSLPRELSLPEDGVLRIQPLRELEQLRYNLKTEKNIWVEAGTMYRLKKISGDAMELMLTIRQGEAERYGVKILCDSTNGKGLDVVVDPTAKVLQVGVARAPLELKKEEEIQLRIFIDRSVVEVFANDRQAVAWQHVYDVGDVGVCLFSEGGAMEVPQLKAWDMKAALPEVAHLSSGQ
jgi:beta-fructofuranosidase